ncbi:hypothetical protein SDC9_117029 [bioreactor metagenome]|uniref:Uncharacterized protein n=1 Tax=bioreactor metagenome TaxID=1076179 RepID=A0A645BY90_9ZZZZ
MCVRELLANALDEHAHAERNDEGFRFLLHYEETVDKADHRTGQDCQQNGEPHIHAAVHELNCHDARKAHYPTYGEVASRRDDGQRYAEGDNFVHRRVLENVEQVIGRVEIRFKEDHRDQHHKDGHDRLLLGYSAQDASTEPFCRYLHTGSLLLFFPVVQPDGQHQNRALEHHLQIGRNAEQVHTVGHQRNQEHTEHRAQNAALAALEGRSADHNREDGVRFVVLADDRSGGCNAGKQHDRTDGGHQPAYGIDQYHAALNRNAREFRSDLVAAGVADGAPAVGLVVEYPQKKQARQKDDERNGEDAHRSGTDCGKYRLRGGQPGHMLRCSTRIDQRDGTVDRAHAVCDEQRFRLRQRTATDEHHTVQKAQKRAEQNAHEQGVDLSAASMRLRGD